MRTMGARFEVAGHDHETTLVVGPGEDRHRLYDVRVMLPGLAARKVDLVHLDVKELAELRPRDIEELGRIRKSCQCRRIHLDIVGLTAADRMRLEATCC